MTQPTLLTIYKMRGKEERAGKRSSFAIEMELIQFVALETGTNPSSYDSPTAIQH